jgi:hypothetical protein
LLFFIDLVEGRFVFVAAFATVRFSVVGQAPPDDVWGWLSSAYLQPAQAGRNLPLWKDATNDA